MSNPPGSFIWYELMTTDADAAAAFYSAVLGWQVAPRAPVTTPDGNDYRMIMRSDGGMAGGLLQLTPAMCQQGATPTWLGYLYVPNVDAAVADIVTDGGSVLLPKMSLPVGEVAMVADPMGTPLYVMNPVPPPDQPDKVSDVFSVDKPQHVRWNQLASADLNRAKAFYARHFSFAFNESMPLGELGDYCFIDHGGMRIGAVMQQPPQSPLGGWLFYFGVESVMAAVRAIEAGGGTVVSPPHEVKGGDWTAIAFDPQGAPFGIAGPLG